MTPAAGGVEERCTFTDRGIEELTARPAKSRRRSSGSQPVLRDSSDQNPPEFERPIERVRYPVAGRPRRSGRPRLIVWTAARIGSPRPLAGAWDRTGRGQVTTRTNGDREKEKRSRRRAERNRALNRRGIRRSATRCSRPDPWALALGKPRPIRTCGRTISAPSLTFVGKSHLATVLSISVPCAGTCSSVAVRTSP